MKVLLTAIFLVPFLVAAQAPAQPAHERKSYIDSLGRYYQQAELPVYLFISNTPDGKPFQLKSDSGGEIKLEGHGEHAFKHFNLVTNKTDEFQIYADGIPPITISTFTGATAFTRGEKKYYGMGLVVSLKAGDEMSGVEAIYQALNDQPFSIYTSFKPEKEGEYGYRYYSVDRTGNAEKVKVASFTIDLSAPKTFHNVVSISSQNVISTNSSIYLTLSDTLSGIAKTFYRFDKENFKPYAGGNIPFQYLPDGEHVLTYFSVDNVANKEIEKSVTFYLDKTAPIMSADVLGDKFIVGDRVYFSGRTKLKLTAVDNKSGIKSIMYSINDTPYTLYEDPFYLPSRSGIHNIKYHAVDNTNNQVKDDFEHEIGVIYVDLTGPSLSHSFSGPSFVKADTVLISPQTKIVMMASDPESGLKKIAYSIDNETSETPYSKSIDMKTSGLHTLDYFGYDNVNNRNSKSVIFFVDTDGPIISSQFAVAPSKEGKYPAYTSLYLSATDNEVGAGEITYSINDGKVQPYNAPIKGFAKNKDYVIKISATDLLGNVSKTEVNFKTDRY